MLHHSLISIQRRISRDNNKHKRLNVNIIAIGFINWLYVTSDKHHFNCANHRLFFFIVIQLLSFELYFNAWIFRFVGLRPGMGHRESRPDILFPTNRPRLCAMRPSVAICPARNLLH